MENLKKELSKRLLENINEFKIISHKNAEISQKRVDLLLSSICGGGLITIFQIFKDIGVENLLLIEVILLGLSAILFLVSLLLNYYSSNISVDFHSLMVVYLYDAEKAIENHIFSGEELKSVEQPNKMKKMTKKIEYLKYGSILGVTIGVFLLSIMFYSYLYHNYNC